MTRHHPGRCLRLTIRSQHLSSIHENHNLNITHRSPTTSQASVRASKPPSQRQDRVVHTGARGVSVAPTTLSLVDNMASDSKFHDEALCQLLHAARNMQIGESARQAVRSAAKARVVELARMSERGEVSKVVPCWQMLSHVRGQLRPGAVLPASVNATQSTNDADRRRMDELVGFVGFDVMSDVLTDFPPPQDHSPPAWSKAVSIPRSVQSNTVLMTPPLY